eukprot:CAMPEP_0174330566 /NCGR_PEP_ID=MMETSP0810-20121108/16785_1 /TAXON_ID=73025 ORGANISM="Eutreptiella gymnastica-like, Strain CCMP1594" /NCGR_SAMPLE_ID=MMETSP0810 /ASSEMBLY_ACC=CAM_ASM_000659 /LENGTH=48 /DNA_ID= /DNA_START= /DNA_END= /DNA_ORIENTATION=
MSVFDWADHPSRAVDVHQCTDERNGGACTASGGAIQAGETGCKTTSVR